MTNTTTHADDVLASMPLKGVFYDRHEERAYARMVEIARHVLSDPSLVKNALAFLDRHMHGDPHQARYYDIWRALLQRPVDQIVSAMLEDSHRGAELRGSAPVFVVLDATSSSVSGRR